jgi:hypothetical protein
LSPAWLLQQTLRPTKTTQTRLLRVVLLFATSTPRVHTRWFPRPSLFRPRRFSRPRRVTPPAALRTYFIPLPRAGFTRFRGFPSDSFKPDSSPGRSLMSLARFASHQVAPMVPARPAPPTGLYSKSESVAQTKVLPHAQTRSPLPLSLLRAFAIHFSPAFTAPPPMTISTRASQ